MQQQQDENYYSLIPGIFEKKTNVTIHYAHVFTVFFTLLIILVVTIITATITAKVESTLNDVTVITDEMSIIMPQIQEGYNLYRDLVLVACQDKNFTKFYPQYAQRVCHQ